MYAVTVNFDLVPETAAEFMPHMVENARRSLSDEPGCRRFDVCVDPTTDARVFLYELYDDRAAFDAHLASPHFMAFDATTRPLVRMRTIQSWTLLDL